jgi:hypothetical protein
MDLTGRGYLYAAIKVFLLQTCPHQPYNLLTVHKQTHTITHSHTITYTITYTITHTHTPSHTTSHTHTHHHIQHNTHTHHHIHHHTHTHTITYTITHTHTHTPSHTQTVIFYAFYVLSCNLVREIIESIIDQELIRTSFLLSKLWLHPHLPFLPFCLSSFFFFGRFRLCL